MTAASTRKLPFASAFIDTVRGADLAPGQYLFEGGVVGPRIVSAAPARGVTVEVKLDDGTERRYLPFEQVRVAIEHMPETQAVEADTESEAS